MKMRKYLLACLFFWILTGGVVFGQTDLRTLDNRDGVLYASGSTEPFTGDVSQGMLKGHVQDGIRVGEWTVLHSNGITRFAMMYDNGDRIWTKNWFESGDLESETYYRNGNRHGESNTWDASGNLRSRFRYVDGRQHGLQEVFDHHGLPLLTSEYADDMRHGETTWWFDAEHKRWETHYSHGKRTGTWIQFSKGGNITMQSEWEDGMLVTRLEDPHQNH